MHMFGFALFALASSPFMSPAADLENPYKNAKVGDTLNYKINVKNVAGTASSTLKQIITGKTEKEVTIKSVAKVLGKEQPAVVMKIDLTKDFDPILTLMKGAKAEKLKVGLDKVKVGLNMSARGIPHARLDVHVGPGSAHTLFRGLPGPILIVRRVGGAAPLLGPPAGHSWLSR